MLRPFWRLCHRSLSGTTLPEAVNDQVGCDDRRFFHLYPGIPALCYGLVGGQIHAVDEWIDLESLRMCTRVLAGVLIDWCGAA